MLTANVSKSEQITEIALTGELDGMTSPQLEQQLSQLLQANEQYFLIRLTALSVITSAGLRVFLGFAKKISKINAKMVLCEMPTNVRNVFDMAGFSNIMTIVTTADQAKALLDPNPNTMPST